MTPDDVKYYRLIASDRVGLNLVGRVIVFILCDEVQRLQAENARLLKIIREVSHSSQLALPVAEPVVPGITQDGMEL